MGICTLGWTKVGKTPWSIVPTCSVQMLSWRGVRARRFMVTELHFVGLSSGVDGCGYDLVADRVAVGGDHPSACVAMQTDHPACRIRFVWGAWVRVLVAR